MRKPSASWRTRFSDRGVRKDRPRLKTKTASRKLVLPEALSPVMRLALGLRSSSRLEKQRKSRRFRREMGIAASEPHGHNHVTAGVVFGVADEATAVGVRQGDAHLFRVQGAQGIHEVGNVEAELELGSLVAHLHL